MPNDDRTAPGGDAAMPHRLGHLAPVGASALVSVAALLVIPASGAAADGAPADGPTFPDGCVEVYEPTSVQALLPDGTLQPARDGDGLGRSYEFAQLGDVREIVPPPGWRPVDATDAELATYGFPPRPEDPAQLAQWEQDYAQPFTPGDLAMCRTDVVNLPAMPAD